MEHLPPDNEKDSQLPMRNISRIALGLTGNEANDRKPASLPVTDISLPDDERERIFDAKLCAVVIVRAGNEELINYRLLRRVIQEKLGGRHGNSWFLPPDGFEVHFSIGEWEPNAQEMVNAFADELACLVGQRSGYVEQSQLAPIDPEAIRRRAEQIRHKNPELFE